MFSPITALRGSVRGGMVGGKWPHTTCAWRRARDDGCLEEAPMRNLTNRQIRLKTRPTDIPQSEHFEVVTEPVGELGDGEVLVRNRFLSVEPAMRGWVSAVANYSTPVGIGEVMRAFAAGEIVTRGTRT